MKCRFLLPILSLFVAAPVLAQVGVHDARLVDRADRPLALRIFYPTAASEGAVLIADTRALAGVKAIPNAPARPGIAPLVIFSHGSGGNLANQAWLAVALAARGMIAVSLNHPGTTTGDNGPPGSAALWERPTDIRRVIDAALHPAAGVVPPQARVDADRIALIGHSLGAFTAVWSLGGRFDPDQFDADCRSGLSPAPCRVGAYYAVGRTPASRALLAADYREPRLGAAVALDIGLARGFTPDSLRGIQTPLLLIPSTEPNPDMPPAAETGYLLKYLPPNNQRSRPLTGAAHFSFLPVCKQGGAALIAAADPEDAVICRDGPGADRTDLHHSVIATVVEFLEKSGF